MMFSNPGVVYCFNIPRVITLIVLLQLVVLASDGRGRKSFAVVTVKVAQDQKPPVFEGAPYHPKPVSENIANYSVVFTLRARDADLKVGVTTVMSTLMSYLSHNCCHFSVMALRLWNDLPATNRLT